MKKKVNGDFIEKKINKNKSYCQGKTFMNERIKKKNPTVTVSKENLLQIEKNLKKFENKIN